MLAGWHCPYVRRVAIGSQEVEHLARFRPGRTMGKRKHVSRKEQRKLKRVKQKEDKHAHFVEQHTRQRRETDQTSMMAPPEHKAGRTAQPNKKQKKKRKETATRARFSSEEELDPDDEEIAYLEKQLGIKKNPDKIKAVQREMVQEDGYDSDFVGWFEDHYYYISGLLQPELYTTFLASIMFFHSIAKAQHREQGKHLSTIIGGIYLLSLQLDSIYTTQRDNTVR